MLILQISIYIKYYQQQTLELFSLQTVPVPYHPNRKSSDENHAYTWLKPDHDMLAMSSSTNLSESQNSYQIAEDLELFTTVRT